MFSNMDDIIYLQNAEIADEVAEFLMKKGYPVGVSSSAIEINGVLTNVKKLDVFKKPNKKNGLVQDWRRGEDRLLNDTPPPEPVTSELRVLKY